MWIVVVVQSNLKYGKNLKTELNQIKLKILKIIFYGSVFHWHLLEEGKKNLSKDVYKKSKIINRHWPKKNIAKFFQKKKFKN